MGPRHQELKTTRVTNMCLPTRTPKSSFFLERGLSVTRCLLYLKMRQRTIEFFSIAALLFSLTGCKQKQYLVGYYDWNGFSQECRWEHFSDEKYKPNARWMDSLATVKDRTPVNVQLFLGCYCGDSKKWVPRFHDMMPDLPVASLEIISVDTTKKDEKGLAALAKVEKIPTFIFLDGQKEIGRIVEKPKKGSLEKNLYHILKNDG